MNTHAGLVNRLLWMQREYTLNSEDRVMQKTPFSFDVSVWEFFWPLLTGACLVIAEPGGHRDPSYLVNLISKEKITTLHFVPSMLRAFLQESDLRPCRSLTKIICSGEALTSDLKDEFFSRLDCDLHNLYGPTETSIDVTHWRCARGEEVGPSVPIGRPIANTQIYILDQDLNHVPVGVPGELHIGGVGVGRGYWHQPELTREKFILDPFCVQPGARLYKSGDLARYRPDGVIEYVGRMDHQIKIRGQRVELGEIEAIIQDYPGVRENVVIMREDPSGDKQLIAYLVVRDKPDPSISELRSFVKQHIPEHMVPSAFVFVGSLPLSPNGKLDRSALPDPQKTRAELNNHYVEPSSPDEIVLARIWAGVLDVDKIGLQDNFFELGGHSLLALQMLSRVREVFEVELPLRSLFDAPTISQLKEAIVGAEQTPGRVEKIAKLFLAVSDMSDDEVSSVLQQKSAAAE
jgi:acyl-coenzyme A synthetase/AMP-(fatty) acid ligase/acyl carrier protein